jgi:hypothetical protein
VDLYLASNGRCEVADENKLRASFGFQEEWEDFSDRNPVFLERFSNLQHAMDLVLFDLENLGEPIDRVVAGLGQVCCEDFNEILICSGNGYGLAAQKLLRGLYERAVTLDYLHKNPLEVDDYLDFHLISRLKLMNVCNATLGPDTFPADVIAEAQEECKSVRNKFEVETCPECKTTRTNHTWNKLDFVAMAHKTAFKSALVDGYYLPLTQAHATVGSLFARLKVKGENISFNADAQRGIADKALGFAHAFLLTVLEIENEHFTIPKLTEQLIICQEDFKEIIQERKVRYQSQKPDNL